MLRRARGRAGIRGLRARLRASAPARAASAPASSLQRAPPKPPQNPSALLNRSRRGGRYTFSSTPAWVRSGETNFLRARNAMASAEDFPTDFAQNGVGLDITTWRILERQIGLMQSSRWLGSTEKGRRSVSAARTANPHSGWASGVRRVWAWVVVGGGRVAGLARAAHTSPIIIYT